MATGTRVGATVWLMMALLAAGMAGACDNSEGATPADGGRDGADAPPAADAAGDGATPDTGNDQGAPADTGGPDAAGDAPAGAGYALIVTETPPGPIIEMSKWAGVRRYTVAAPGAPLVLAGGIDKSLVRDPEAVAYREDTSEVFVANRHGDNAADGVPGSVSRFRYDLTTGAFTPGPTITGNGLNIPGQMAFHPDTGELFVSNFYLSGGGAAVSRFTFDGADIARSNGVLGEGATQGLVLSPDGKRLYLTSGGRRSNVIRQYEVATGNKSPDFVIPEAKSLFFMHLLGDEIYVADLDGNKIFRLAIAAGNDLTVTGSFAADGPVSIAFSPDETEMFTAGHLTSDLIDRFVYDEQNDTWTPMGKLDTTQSLGGLIILPLE
jgi:hypothetical protein